MVGMGMSLEYPFQLQIIRLNKLDHPVCRSVSGPT